MGNNQHTAVEWFYQMILPKNTQAVFLLAKDIEVLLEQAKEMEKEQHYNTYKAGASLALMSMKGLNGMSFEQYYNETYGKE